VNANKYTTTERLISVRDAGRLRGIHAPRLWAAIRDGSLPAFQIGGWLRVRIGDVDRWIESMRVIPDRNPLSAKIVPDRQKERTR